MVQEPRGKPDSWIGRGTDPDWVESDKEWVRRFAAEQAAREVADRAEEERIADLTRQLREAKAARARKHRERHKPVAFSLTDSAIEMLRMEADRRRVSRSALISELIEAAHRGELDPL